MAESSKLESGVFIGTFRLKYQQPLSEHNLHEPKSPIMHCTIIVVFLFFFSFEEERTFYCHNSISHALRISLPIFTYIP